MLMLMMMTSVSANQAPEIISVDVVNGNSHSPGDAITIMPGDDLVLNPSWNEPDGDPVTFLWDNGLAISYSDQSIHLYGDDYNVGDSYTISLQVSDGSLSDTATFPLDVVPFNTQPTIDSVTVNGDSVGSFGSYTILDNEVADVVAQITDNEGDATIYWTVDTPVTGQTTGNVPNFVTSYSIDASQYSLGEHTVQIRTDDGSQGFIFQFTLNIEQSNTEPVINSITPNDRIELKNGETQLFTANVTDEDGDADYTWTLGGVTVSTSDTFQADCDDIKPGIYTLTLTVNDSEYTKTKSSTLEIRAKGGNPTSGGSGITGRVVDNVKSDYAVNPKEQTSSDRIGLKIKSITSAIGKFFSFFEFWR